MTTRKVTHSQLTRRARRAHQVQTSSPTPRFYWLPITEEKIRQAAQKIVDAVHPEK